MNVAEDTEFNDLLDVVNCAEHSDEIIEHNVYTCPVEGRHYQHKCCKYLGMYKDKRVAYVALIDAVIDVHSKNHAEVCWINGTKKSDGYIKMAIEKAVLLRKDVTCTRKITPMRWRESTKIRIGDSSYEKDIYRRADRQHFTRF